MKSLLEIMKELSNPILRSKIRNAIVQSKTTKTTRKKSIPPQTSLLSRKWRARRRKILKRHLMTRVKNPIKMERCQKHQRQSRKNRHQAEKGHPKDLENLLEVRSKFYMTSYFSLNSINIEQIF